MIITDDTTYRSHPCPSFSTLKHILTSPLHYQAALRKPVEQSKAMLLGSMLHSRVLENKEYPVAVMPRDLDGRTKEGRAWKEANAGRDVISSDEHDQYKRMVAACDKNADLQYLLKKCDMREVGIVTKYRGLELKGKLDASGIDEAGNRFILDLKSSQSADPFEFGRSASSMKYFMQMCLYTTLLSLELKLESEPAWFWVVCENSEAADVCIFQPPQDAIEIGRAQLNRAVDLYIECSTSGKWPGRGNGILELEISPFERRKWIK